MAFTIFAFGSGQSYDKNKNVNTQFFDACKGNKLSLDGPQKLGGMYDKEKIENNIQTAQEAILAWAKTAEPDEKGKYVVNLTGFSRGAVTCLMIANTLQKMIDKGELKNAQGEPLSINHFEVNIYADDPVAGFSDKAEPRARIIPPVVKNYVAMLQMDERRAGFKPQDRSRIVVQDFSNTNVTFLPLVGHHSAANKVKKTATKDTPILHANMKYNFLRAHGTEFEDYPTIQVKKGVELTSADKKAANHVQLLEHYANSKKQRARYLKKAQGFKLMDLPIPGRIRSFNANFADYVTDSFFINQHERELFKLTYPKVFNYLFEKGCFDPTNPADTGFVRTGFIKEGKGYPLAKANDELFTLKKNNPGLFEQLQQAGKIPPNKSDTHLPLNPTGEARIERCKFLTSAVKIEDPFENQLDLLQKQITQASYLYEREKPDWESSETRQYQRAHDMRIEMASIVNGPDISYEKKYLKALNYVERNYKELVAGNYQDTFSPRLGTILAAHDRTYNIQVKKDIDMKPALLSVGQIIRKVIKFPAVVLNTAGEYLSSMSERVFEISTSGPPARKWTLGALGGIIAAALYGAGKLLSGIASGANWLCQTLEKRGRAKIQSSGAIIITPIEPSHNKKAVWTDTKPKQNISTRSILQTLEHGDLTEERREALAQAFSLTGKASSETAPAVSTRNDNIHDFSVNPTDAGKKREENKEPEVEHSRSVLDLPRFTRY